MSPNLNLIQTIIRSLQDCQSSLDDISFDGIDEIEALDELLISAEEQAERLLIRINKTGAAQKYRWLIVDDPEHYEADDLVKYTRFVLIDQKTGYVVDRHVTNELPELLTTQVGEYMEGHFETQIEASLLESFMRSWGFQLAASGELFDHRDLYQLRLPFEHSRTGIKR